MGFGLNSEGASRWWSTPSGSDIRGPQLFGQLRVQWLKSTLWFKNCFTTYTSERRCENTSRQVCFGSKELEVIFQFLFLVTLSSRWPSPLHPLEISLSKCSLTGLSWLRNHISCCFSRIKSIDFMLLGCQSNLRFGQIKSFNLVFVSLFIYYFAAHLKKLLNNFQWDAVDCLGLDKLINHMWKATGISSV